MNLIRIFHIRKTDLNKIINGYWYTSIIKYLKIVNILGSNQTTSSSETGSIRTSPSVSRTASCASDQSGPSTSSDATSGRGSMARY